MPKLRVHNVTVSVDGYMAGPRQSTENPMGEGTRDLHAWMFATRTGRAMFGGEGGDTGVDDEFASRNNVGVGATIMGRNMFGPVRGPWPDEDWRGWWGEDPPYHHDTFVLTHFPRPSLPMEGGTTFHFAQDDIETVLDRAYEAAGGLDVQLGGGASTIQQFLSAGLIDDMHVVIAPVLLGSGERLFGEGLDVLAAGYDIAETVRSDAVTHVRLTRRG